MTTKQNPTVDETYVVEIPASQTLFYNNKKILKVALFINKIDNDVEDTEFSLPILTTITHPVQNDKPTETLFHYKHKDIMNVKSKTYELQSFDVGGFATMKLKINPDDKIEFETLETDISRIFVNGKNVNSDHSDKYEFKISYNSLKDFKNPTNPLTNEVKIRVENVVNAINKNSSSNTTFKFVIFQQIPKDNVLVFKNNVFNGRLNRENVYVKILPKPNSFLDVNDNEIPIDTKLEIGTSIYRMKKIPTTTNHYSSIFLDFPTENNINITKGNLDDAHIGDTKLNCNSLEGLDYDSLKLRLITAEEAEVELKRATDDLDKKCSNSHDAAVQKAMKVKTSLKVAHENAVNRDVLAAKRKSDFEQTRAIFTNSKGGKRKLTKRRRPTKRIRHTKKRRPIKRRKHTTKRRPTKKRRAGKSSHKR